MNTDNYLKERLEGQIEWNNRKANINKKIFQRLSTATILFALSLPSVVIYLLLLETDETGIEWWLGYIGFSGLIIGVLTILNHIYNYQDKWSHYRTVAESLKKERNLYQMQAGPYKHQNEPIKILVERVEKLVSPRNS
jgi:hypothetical protein